MHYSITQGNMKMKIQLIVWWLSVAAFALTAAVYAWQERFLAAVIGALLSIAIVAQRFAIPRTRPRLQLASGVGVGVAAWVSVGVAGAAFAIGAALLSGAVAWKPVTRMIGAWRRRKRVEDSVIVDVERGAVVAAVEAGKPVDLKAANEVFTAPEPVLLTPTPAPQPPKYSFKTVTVN